MIRCIEQGIDLSDRHLLGAVHDLFNEISSAYFALLNDAEVEARCGR
jgi:hypothetical protein